MNFDFLTLLNKSILGFRHGDADGFPVIWQPSARNTNESIKSRRFRVSSIKKILICGELGPDLHGRSLCFRRYNFPSICHSLVFIQALGSGPTTRRPREPPGPTGESWEQSGPFIYIFRGLVNL